MSQPNPYGGPPVPPPVPPGWQQNPQPQPYVPPGYGPQAGYQAAAPGAAPGVAPGGPTLQYATPFGMGQAGAGVWRDGDKLVTTVNAALPRQCVKCGAPADGAYGPRKFYWAHPALYLLILVNVLVCLIVVLIVRKRATVEVGLCERHLSRRRWAIAWTSILAVLGLAVLVGGIVVGAEQRMDWLILVALIAAVAMWLTAVFVGSRLGTYLIPTKIDAHYAFFKGAGVEFLTLFPPVR